MHDVTTDPQPATAPGPVAVTSAPVIAVLTYRRPDDLAQVLPALVVQAAATAPRARVLVVDNDPDAGAREAVAAFAADGVEYAHEPQPGIAAARNRALDAAGDAELLVFIDDDERPDDGWLRALVQVQREHGCAAVVGPVRSEFDGELTPWVAAGRFFDRRRLETGAPVDVAATNNLLLDLRQVRDAGLRFDERFGLSGGSDSLFTRQLVAAGGRMVWCAEAMVTDRVPASRTTRRWVLQRAFRSGNTHTRALVALAGSPAGRLRVRLRVVPEGLVRVVGGVVRVVQGVVTRDLGRRVRGVRTICRGAGMVAGTWGIVYSEYARRS
ncbi:glycosyltransferase family 2 protein [Angustibacter aerolatus]